MPHTEWTERTRSHHVQHIPTYDGQGAYHHRQPFHHPRSSLGATGHLLHISMVAAPLIIGEAIKDPEKKWRAMRFVPVAGALASELLWTMKISHERKKDEENRMALEECYGHCR